MFKILDVENKFYVVLDKEVYCICNKYEHADIICLLLNTLLGIGIDIMKKIRDVKEK